MNDKSHQLESSVPLDELVKYGSRTIEESRRRQDQSADDIGACLRNNSLTLEKTCERQARIDQLIIDVARYVFERDAARLIELGGGTREQLQDAATLAKLAAVVFAESMGLIVKVGASHTP